MSALVSIIVRTLGRPSLGRTLASIDAQGRDDLQVILVDAGGALEAPDGGRTPWRLVGGGGPLPRARAAALGLAAADTPLALFLDDDDELLPGHVGKLVDALAAHPEAVLAYTGVAIDGAPGADDPSQASEAFEAWELLLGNRMPIHAALFRVAAAAGATFDPGLTLYEDWDFWLQMRLAGPFVWVPGVSARYHIGAQSSAVHRVRYCEEAYWRVWRKWWTLAPPEWWVTAFQRAMSATAQDQALAHAQADGARAREELAAARQLITDLERRREAQDQALAHAQADGARAREQLAAVLQSSTWRLTAGLRRGADWLRRWRHRLVNARHRSFARPGLVASVLPDPYHQWLRRQTERENGARAPAGDPVTDRPTGPTISVLVPVYNPEPAMLDAALGSVLAQSYPRWELCLADDASTRPGVRERLRAWAARDPRIRLVERPANGHISACSNSALGLARGEWVALLDQDDLLAPEALGEVARAAAQFPDAGLIFSDEDKLDARGRRFGPYFKPAFNLELLRGQNLISHLGVYRRALVEAVGGFREGYEGSQDHDLALRCVERLRPGQVIHIPRVLYHWRVHPGSAAAGAGAKPYAPSAGLRAVNDSLDRTEPGARAEALSGTPFFRVRYPVPAPPPIDVVVRARDGSPAVAPWIDAVRAGTALREAAVVVVAPETPATLDRGVRSGGAPWILLLRHGLIPARAGWLDEMASLLVRPGVGIVGARLERRDGTLSHAGVTRRPDGRPLFLHAGLPPGHPGYFGRAALTQAVSAVSGGCLLVRREAFEAAGGFAGLDGAPGTLDLDFCERARTAGWRVLWTPFAVLAEDGRALDRASPSRRRPQDRRRLDAAAPAAVVEDPAFNPNLSLDSGRFELARAPRPGQPRPGF